jgi:hypothetical protein
MLHELPRFHEAEETTLLHDVGESQDTTHSYEVILRAAATPFEARRLGARAPQSRHFALLRHDVDRCRRLECG